MDKSDVSFIWNFDSYKVYDNLEEKILNIRLRDSYKFEIFRSNLVSLQNKIKNKTQIVLKLHKKQLRKSFLAAASWLEEMIQYDGR